MNIWNKVLPKASVAQGAMGQAPQSDKPRISFVLTGGEQQEQRWKEHRQQHYGTMAEMVRTAVEREIEGHHDTPAETPQSGREGEQVGEVLNAVRQMQSTLEDMDSRIGHLERQAETEGPKYDLKKAVFAVLPEQPEGVRTPADRWDRDNRESGELDSRIHRWAATAEEIARKLGAEPDEVEDALDNLAETTGQVITGRSEDVGRTFYWKKGGP